MKRRPDWPERLYEKLHALEPQAFAWGSHDCCLFVASCIEAMTGHDPAKDYRGRYENQGEAFLDLKRFFGGGIEKMAEQMTASLGFAEITPSFAQRGDVLLTDLGEIGPALGIVTLSGHGLFLLPKGMTEIPVNFCRRAWRV